MTISSNPTLTKTIEANWNREINRRWSEFKRRILAALVAGNANAQLANQSGPFVLDPSQQRQYMVFLEAQIELLLLGDWQQRYQAQAYQRGLESLRRSLQAQGISLIPTAAEQFAAAGLSTFTATATIGTISAAPIHREALEFLFNRSFESLKGWTDRMARETRTILFTAIAEGKGVEEVTREISKRVDVSRSSARRIAQTETNQAYSRASIAEAQRASEEIDETVNLRWLTVRDGKVRDTHARLHGIVMTPERASEVKTTDGVNCRCGLAPVIPEADTVAKTEKFATERKQLLALAG